MPGKKSTVSNSMEVIGASSESRVRSVEVERKGTKSQALAKLVTTSALSSITLKSYSGCGDDLDAYDLMPFQIFGRCRPQHVLAGQRGRGRELFFQIVAVGHHHHLEAAQLRVGTQLAHQEHHGQALA